MDREVKNWMHRDYGPITGIEVGGDGEWIKIILVGDHAFDSFKRKRDRRSGRSGNGFMTRRGLITEVGHG